jgi:predicted nucleic acid-binding protein
MHYIDTSVLTAYYHAEARSQRVQRVLSRIEGPTVSPLVEVELYGVVARKVRSGDVGRDAALQLFARFQSHLDESRFQVVPIGVAEYGLAREWLLGLTSPLRVLDALHLAAASNNDLRLVTADKSLADSAKRFGVKHRLIS